MRTLPKLFLAAIVAGLAGCYAEAEPVTVTSAEVGVGYEPAYYDGYVVYYDDGGRPFYYDPGGAVVWVEPSSPYYVGLVNHYHVYGGAYHRWYNDGGYRYRGYRAAAPGAYAYHGYRTGAVPAAPSRRAPAPASRAPASRARIPAQPRVNGGGGARTW